MLKNIFFFILYVIASLLILKVIIPPGFVIDKRSDLIDMMEGKAMTPFQYRLFIPTLSQLIVQYTPESIKDRLQKYLEKSDRFQRDWDHYHLPATRLVPFYITWLLNLGCFLGSLYTWRALAKYYYPQLPLIVDFTPLLGALLIPLFFRYNAYPYDAMTIFISSLLFYLISKEMWITYIPVFLISLFCRETTFLFLLLAFAKKTERTLGFYAYLGALVACWAAVRFGMIIYYEDNGHVPFDTPLMNFHFLLAFPTAAVYDAIMFLFIGFLVFKNWTQKDLFLKKAFLILFIPLSLLMLSIGRVDEFRVLNEGFSVLLMLAVSTVLSFYPQTDQELSRDSANTQEN